MYVAVQPESYFHTRVKRLRKTGLKKGTTFSRKGEGAPLPILNNSFWPSSVGTLKQTTDRFKRGDQSIASYDTTVKQIRL